ALATHCRFWTEKCRSVRITGNATFTMVPSRRSMNATAHIKARVSLPRGVSRKEGGADAADRVPTGEDRPNLSAGLMAPNVNLSVCGGQPARYRASVLRR